MPGVTASKTVGGVPLWAIQLMAQCVGAIAGLIGLLLSVAIGYYVTTQHDAGADVKAAIAEQITATNSLRQTLNEMRTQQERSFGEIRVTAAANAAEMSGLRDRITRVEQRQDSAQAVSGGVH